MGGGGPLDALLGWAVSDPDPSGLTPLCFPCPHGAPPRLREHTSALPAGHGDTPPPTPTEQTRCPHWLRHALCPGTNRGRKEAAGSSGSDCPAAAASRSPLPADVMVPFPPGRALRGPVTLLHTPLGTSYSVSDTSHSSPQSHLSIHTLAPARSPSPSHTLWITTPFQAHPHHCWTISFILRYPPHTPLRAPHACFLPGSTQGPLVAQPRPSTPTKAQLLGWEHTPQGWEAAAHLLLSLGLSFSLSFRLEEKGREGSAEEDSRAGGPRGLKFSCTVGPHHTSPATGWAGDREVS